MALIRKYKPNVVNSSQNIWAMIQRFRIIGWTIPHPFTHTKHHTNTHPENSSPGENSFAIWIFTKYQGVYRFGLIDISIHKVHWQSNNKCAIWSSSAHSLIKWHIRNAMNQLATNKLLWMAREVFNRCKNLFSFMCLKRHKCQGVIWIAFNFRFSPMLICDKHFIAVGNWSVPINVASYTAAVELKLANQLR